MSNTQQPSVSPKARPTAKLRIQPLPRYPDIVLALNVIDTDPPRFHWYLFVPDVPNAADAHLDVQLQRGLKMHATTDYSPSDAERLWCFDATPTTLATDEGGLAAAATVGRLGIGIDPEPDLSNTNTGSGRPVPVPRSQEGLREMFARIPMAVPEADGERERVFTCRVWVREALRRMHEEGYVDCPDVDALEEEMWRYGRAAARAIEDDTFSVAELVQAVASRAVA